MNHRSSIADLTDKVKKAGPGMDTRKLWMCNHKSKYGIWRGRIAWRCDACEAARIGQPPVRA